MLQNASSIVYTAPQWTHVSTQLSTPHIQNGLPYTAWKATPPPNSAPSSQWFWWLAFLGLILFLRFIQIDTFNGSVSFFFLISCSFSKNWVTQLIYPPPWKKNHIKTWCRNETSAPHNIQARGFLEWNSQGSPSRLIPCYIKLAPLTLWAPCTWQRNHDKFFITLSYFKGPSQPQAQLTIRGTL